jgi:hypothetical protein
LETYKTYKKLKKSIKDQAKNTNGQTLRDFKNSFKALNRLMCCSWRITLIKKGKAERNATKNYLRRKRQCKDISKNMKPSQSLLKNFIKAQVLNLD